MKNPFQSTLANAWDDEFVDLGSLNGEASDFIGEQIDAVRAACLRSSRGGGELHSSSVLLLGSPGVGKTHLFNRLRARFDRFAVFVLHRPDIVAEANARHVLANTLEAMRKSIVRSEHRQLDAIAGAVLAHAAGVNPDYPVSYYRLVRDCPAQEIEARVEQAVARASTAYPEVWPEYLSRLLRTAFLPEGQDRWAAMSWLSGREPSEAQLRRLGEKTGIADGDVLRALRTLGVGAGYGAPIVLVFDQLENLVEDDGGTSRIRAHARLVSELRDNVRGIVVVQMALETEWIRRIRPCLVGGERDRVEENLRLLSLPTSDQRMELVRLWLDRLPATERHGGFPWPFTEGQLQAWTREEGMTPRMLMQACSDQFLRGREEPSDALAIEQEPLSLRIDDRMQELWSRYLEEARCRVDEGIQAGTGVDGELLEGAIARALALAGVSLDRRRPIKGAPSLHVKREGRPLDIVVAQQVNHTSLAATLRKAIARADQNDVLVVRESALALSPGWRVVAGLLGSLLLLPGTRYLDLQRNELVGVLALQALIGAARSQDLSDARGGPIAYEVVTDWAARKLAGEEWQLVEALLADRDPTPAPLMQAEPPPATELIASPVVELLRRLRVASIERLHAEARHADGTIARKQVMEALSDRSVRWFGDSIVAFREGRS